MEAAHAASAAATNVAQMLRPNDPQSQKALWWGIVGATALAAGTTFWWLTREKYYSYVPIQASAPLPGAAPSSCSLLGHLYDEGSLSGPGVAVPGQVPKGAKLPLCLPAALPPATLACC